MTPRLRVAALVAVAGLTISSCAALGLAGRCDGTQIIGLFEQVGDLVVNANVQADDVVIGSIQDIELQGWHAKVTMCIDAGEELPQDSELIVRTTSLLGEKFVDFRTNSEGPPFLEDGAVLEPDQTSKATELEEVFAKLASVLGTGNLEQINRFTSAQAEILEGNEGDLREVLSRLRRFTGLLAERKGQIASSVDNLDAVARTVLSDQSVLEQFLASFADSSAVLNDQKEGLESLLVSLDRFTNISVRLLDSTEQDLNEQFKDLRPVLRVIVANSENLRETLQTLATFSQWFPETMPGDYLQLDVCQAPPETYHQGTTCPQAIDNDDPGAARAETLMPSSDDPSNAIQYLLEQPLRSGS